MLRNFFKSKKHYDEVSPDEIFLDSQNLSELDTQQFEGVIERPLSRRHFIMVALFFTACIFAFIIRLSFLQIAQGESFFAQSESNRLHRTTLFSERGIIYDRNGVELAWNVPGESGEPFSYRAYYEGGGLAHILGFVRYPRRDRAGFFWRLNFEGVSGAEELFNEQLQGIHGVRLIETNARNVVQSEGVVVSPTDGDNVMLTIDGALQSQLHASMSEMVERFGYEGGAAVIMNIHNGDIVAMTSYPEFDPHTISEGNDRERIAYYFQDRSRPSLNRVISGLYTPGSIVKPFVALGMLNEDIITETTTINSTGRLEIPNPWNPSEPAIFRDWRPRGHGITDVYHAIADSVNTFFYIFGGGYDGRPGLGIARIQEYLEMFGIAQPVEFTLGSGPSGLIPHPEWKQRIFNDAWRLGDTFNTVIGQFGTQVTPLQMVRATAGLADYGALVRPRIHEGERIEKTFTSPIDNRYYEIIHEGMRQTVTQGTAQSLNVPYVAIAAKTGTAQTRGNTRVNAWSIGFWPYEDPQYAFTIVMEDGPSQDNVGSSWAMRQTFDWMRDNAPEYFEY